jgi:hypothetical protein
MTSKKPKWRGEGEEEEEFGGRRRRIWKQRGESRGVLACLAWKE